MIENNRRLIIAILVCFIIIVVFGFLLSGLLGSFIGGLIAGLIAKGVTRGAIAAFLASIFASTLLTILALVGFILFDDVLIGRLLWDSAEYSVLGIAILLEFLGIGMSVVGGLVGSALSRGP
jgi:hypothetical protein